MKMNTNDTIVWAAVYARCLKAEDADFAVTEYRKRRGGPSSLFFDGMDFVSESDLIAYLKEELYKARP